MIGRLPETPEQISSEWLSAAIASVHPGARAVSVELVAAHSGTTGRALLRVAWAPGTALPERVFVKLPPSDATQRSMVDATDMGRREARFYAGLSREVPVRVPGAIWSGWGDESSQYLMLLEDLAASGCDFPLSNDPAILDFARALMDELARLHGHFAGWSRFARAHPWVDQTMRNEWGRMLVQAGLDTFRDASPPEFAAIGEIYVAHMEAWNDWLDRGPHTLIHGDCHLGNLFRDGTRPGFLDWACLAHAPGMRDVAYFLTNSLPTSLRQKEERDLLMRYRYGLAASGVKPPPFDETWRDYRRFALVSWVAATTTAAAGSRMQPIEIGMRAMARTNAAVRDLDSLSLVREELGV